MSRYQGLVALDGGSLEDAAHEYFMSSEQIPTRVRLAVGEEMSPGAGHRWRAGGMLLQFLPKAPERARVPDLDPGDAPEGTPAHVVAEDDAWVEGRSLIETVEDLELIDPALSSERLVYRLFHERGVRVFKSVPIAAQCSCSRDGVEAMLRSFSQDDRDHMVENGMISVTCEFCSANYQFAPDDVRPDAHEPGEAKPEEQIQVQVMIVSARRDGRGDCRGGRGARAFDGAGAARKAVPAPLAEAKRLVLVTRRHDERHGRDHAALRARLGAEMRGARSAPPEPALIGRGGMGWSQFFAQLARRGEPIKVEGDKRAPAGIYSIGRSFGIVASSRPNYLQVTPDTICVDDPSSPAYNTIASRARLGPAVSAENMSRALPMYRRGLLVDYPTDAEEESRLVHLHPCLALAHDRHRRLRRRCPSRGSRRCRISPPTAPCSRSCRAARLDRLPGCLAANRDSVQRRLALRAVERKRRDLDVEAFAGLPSPCRSCRS